MNNEGKDPDAWRLGFSISDLGKLLGRSPSTLRKWEQSGLVSFPRDPSGDRRLFAEDVERIVEVACQKRRISKRRSMVINEIMSGITKLEKGEA